MNTYYVKHDPSHPLIGEYEVRVITGLGDENWSFHRSRAEAEAELARVTHAEEEEDEEAKRFVEKISRGPGRPRIHQEPRRKVTLTLPEILLDAIPGEMTATLEEALVEWLQRHISLPSTVANDQDD